MSECLGTHEWVPYRSTKRLALKSAQTQTFTFFTRAGALAQTGLILLTPHLKSPDFLPLDTCSSGSHFEISSFTRSFQPNPNPSRPHLLSLLFYSDSLMASWLTSTSMWFGFSPSSKYICGSHQVWLQYRYVSIYTCVHDYTCVSTHVCKIGLYAHICICMDTHILLHIFLLSEYSRWKAA